MEAYLSGHQSSLRVSGSPPILNVNWVICGRGTALSGGSLELTRALQLEWFKQSHIKHLQRLPPPLLTLSICFLGLFWFPLPLIAHGSLG